MSTATKTFSFLSDAEGLADGGLTAKITASWNGATGNPLGSLKVVTDNLNNTTAETIVHSAAVTWDSLFTEVTATDIMTGLQLVSGDWYAPASPPPVWEPGASLIMTVDVVDATTGVSVLSDMLYTKGLPAHGLWTEFVMGDSPQRAVLTGKQVGSTQVKFKITFTPSLEEGATRIPNAAADLEFYLDNILLRATFTPVSDPGGGGSGGDGGGGGGGGDTSGGDEGDGWSTYDTVWPVALAEHDCDEPNWNEGPLVQHMLQRAVMWTHEQRLYCSYAGRTLCYDTVLRAWTDVGYGAVEYGMSTQEGDHPETMWLVMARYWPPDERIDQEIPANEPNVVFASHRGLTNNDPSTGLMYKRRLVLGPYDGTEAARGRSKRAVRLVVWGSVTDVDLRDSTSEVGTLTLRSDSGYSETYPIRLRWLKDSGAQIGMAGTIIDQQFTPSMRGQVLMADIVFGTKCVSVTESMLEYVVIR